MSEGNVLETVSLTDKYRLDTDRALINGRQVPAAAALLARLESSREVRSR